MTTNEWVKPEPRKFISYNPNPLPIHNYTDSKLYDYIINHQDRSEISNIFSESIVKSYRSMGIRYENEIIRNGYKMLFDKKFFDIIYEIIDGTNSFDQFVICRVAIDNENYDILNLAISKGFDVKKVDPVFEQDLLHYAVGAKNLAICQYLVNEGASPFTNNCVALAKSCIIDPDDILEYFLELHDIQNKHLRVALLECFRMRDFNKKKIKMILDRGIDLNCLDQEFFDMICHTKIDDFKFLFENGLEFNSNILLGAACANNNIELVRICLENGLRPNNDILEKVLKILNKPILELFYQYNIDFSSIPDINEFDDMIIELEKKGLDRTNFLKILLRNYHMCT